MTDKERIDRISKLLNELDFAEVTHEEYKESIYYESVNDIVSTLWRLYCFVSDVRDTLNM